MCDDAEQIFLCHHPVRQPLVIAEEVEQHGGGPTAEEDGNHSWKNGKN
jgi:hypothetical protein